MDTIKKKKSMLALSVAMFATAIFMTISYHNKITIGNADIFSEVAYYVWIIAIPVSVIYGIHYFRSLRKDISKT